MIRPSRFPQIRNLLFAIAGLLAAPALQASEPTDPKAHYAGINLWFLNDFDGSNAFVNMMMHSRTWEIPGWGAPVASDAEGWPTADASTIMFGKDNQLGTYKLIFEGQANVVLMWTAGAITNKIYDSATNTTTADVTITNSVTGGLTFTSTRRTSDSASGTGVRNVRLYRPGHAADGSELFDRRFLALMAPFHVIRFMDWVVTNRNGEVSWANRWRPGMNRRPNFSHEGQSGLTHSLPLEYMIALSNQLDADMWLNIPVWADDDYVTKTALALKYGTDGTNPYTSPQTNPVWPPLKPNLKVHVEYANEIWNSAPGFRCFPWVLSIADRIIADPAPHPTKLNTSTGAYDVVDRYTIQARYSAWRSAQISDLFRAVWGDAEINKRIRVALMGQNGGNYFNPRQLPWLDAFYNRSRPATDPFPNSTLRPVHHFFHSAGGSAYYGVNSWASAAPDDFFAPGNYPETAWAPKISADALRAKNYGLKRIAYEGGQGLDLFGRTGNAAATDAQKLAINADPRMEDMVKQYHDVWTANAGELLVYYVNTGAVDWEFTPNVWNLDSPKLRAARAIINDRQRVPVTLGQEIPGTLVGRAQSIRDVVGSTFDSTASTSEPLIGGLDVGESLALPINTRNRGLYRVRVRAGTTNNTTAIIQLSVNGSPAGTVSLAGAGDTVLRDSAPLELVIPDEFNAIRVTPVERSLRLHSLTFEYLGLAIATPAELPPAQQGLPYSLTLTGSGGLPPYSWSVTAGALPSGLTLDPATGIISGTPASAGVASFSVTLADAFSPAATAVRQFTMNVNATPQGAPILENNFNAVPTGNYNGSTGAPFGADALLGNATGLNTAQTVGTSNGVEGSRGIESADTAIRTRALRDIRQNRYNYSLYFQYNPASTTLTGNFIGAGWALPAGADGVNTWNLGNSDKLLIGLRRTDAATNAIRLVNAANLSVVESAITGGSADLLTTNLTPGRWYEMTFDLSFQHNSESPSASTVTVANLQLRDRGTDGSLSGNILLQLASTTYNHPHGVNLDSTHDAYAVVIANRDRGARILDNLRISAFGFPPESFTLTYASGANGSLSGSNSQTVTSGGTGTAVAAVPDSGYAFSQWSDGSTANPRIDTNVTADLSVTAQFAAALTPYEVWLASHPAYDGLTEAQRAPAADPFGTRVANLLVFALDLDPLRPLLPTAEIGTVGEQSRLQYTFTPHQLQDLRYFIEASNDLSDWSDQTELTHLLTLGQPHTHHDSADLSTAPRRFLRMRVTQP